MYNAPYSMPGCYQGPGSYKTLDEALKLVKDAVQGEREDELFYDYLISVAPTREEKDIIAAIRDDEKKHNRMFREIYKYFTGREITAPEDVEFERPNSYVEGIRRALFGELAAMERYRDIRAGLPGRYFRNMAFEILTDELKHGNKYNYILNLHFRENPMDSLMRMYPFNPVKKSFTTEEAAEIARALGIDFSREKFDLEQFRKGLDVELEHGRQYSPTNVTGDDPLLTGKIALAHLREFPDYYTRLTKLEEEAKAYWGMNRNMPQNGAMQPTPDQLVTYITPLVQRALAEMAEGINMEHLFQEFILSGVLVGAGYSPQEAIEQVETWERTGESKLLKESKMKK